MWYLPVSVLNIPEFLEDVLISRILFAIDGRNNCSTSFMLKKQPKNL